MQQTDSLVNPFDYNEKENMEKIIRKVFSLAIAFDILIVDDGSPDGTADIVRKLQQEFPHQPAIWKNGKIEMEIHRHCHNGFNVVEVPIILQTNRRRYTPSGLLTAPLKPVFGINSMTHITMQNWLTTIVLRSATILNTPISDEEHMKSHAVAVYSTYSQCAAAPYNVICTD
ncbi:hypothetical protein FQR65_LT20673 [Abscondita terminalis]|nr:hypothetical protein FQR65_LT20673 [Abscondita terminalis]